MPDVAESLRQEIPTVLRALAQARNTGVLRVTAADAEAEVMLIKGEVAWARACGAKQLGAAFVDRCAISPADLKGVIAIQKRKKVHQPIATILLEMGLVERDVAETEIEIQVLEVLRLILGWGRGEYKFQTVRTSSYEHDKIVFPACGNVDLLLQNAGVSD